MTTNTSAPVGGTVTSGNFANRSNASFPDIEQQKREQARQEHDWAEGNRVDHPEFTRNGPSFEDESTTPDSNLSREESQTLGYTQ